MTLILQPERNQFDTWKKFRKDGGGGSGKVGRQWFDTAPRSHQCTAGSREEGKSATPKESELIRPPVRPLRIAYRTRLESGLSERSTHVSMDKVVLNMAMKRATQQYLFRTKTTEKSDDELVRRLLTNSSFEGDAPEQTSVTTLLLKTTEDARETFCVSGWKAL